MKKTLEEIIKSNGYKKYDPLTIEYRTWAGDKSDILAGYCKYTSGKLISMDGDSYYLNDEIADYEFQINDGKPLLTVWYESNWN